MIGAYICLGLAVVAFILCAYMFGRVHGVDQEQKYQERENQKRIEATKIWSDAIKNCMGDYYGKH